MVTDDMVVGRSLQKRALLRYLESWCAQLVHSAHLKTRHSPGILHNYCQKTCESCVNRRVRVELHCKETGTVKVRVIKSITSLFASHRDCRRWVQMAVQLPR
jgi:hypothetical protein